MMPNWINSISPAGSASGIHAGLIFGVAWLFLVAGLVFVVALLASRVIKSHLERRKGRAQLAFQKILNKIIINEAYADKPEARAAFEFHLAELRMIAKGSFARQVLIAQIMDLNKNLTGTSANALRKCYYEVDLHKESLRKLNSIAWKKRALGIRELAEMSNRDSVATIESFLYTRNHILWQEAFMALVKLESTPLSFLYSYKGNLTLWMRINIYRYLSTLEHRRLPIFSSWFSHSNEAVRLFCMSMARQFKQMESLPGLAEMVYDKNPKVVRLAVSAIGEMEATGYKTLISSLALHARRFPKLARAVVACLGKIGQPDEDIPLLTSFLTHPDYDVRYETVKVLKKFGDAGERKLLENSSNALDGLLRHFSEPLLAAS